MSKLKMGVPVTPSTLPLAFVPRRFPPMLTASWFVYCMRAGEVLDAGRNDGYAPLIRMAQLVKRTGKPHWHVTPAGLVMRIEP